MRPIDAEKLEEILRSRCAQCSDDYGSIAGAVNGCLKLVQSQPTIVPPPNPPLTPEELREMDGEPVWITDIVDGVVFREQWALIFSVEEDAICFSTKERGDDSRRFSLYGTGWLAYRRKPEWGKNDERK